MHQDRPVAIVTGAGSGIGREVARLLAAEGYALTLVGRRPDKLDETRGLIDGDVLVVAADVSAPRAAPAIVDATMRRWSRADVLVNNAGGVEIAPLASLSDDHLERMFAVNVLGPLRLVSRLWGVFVAQGGGCVVNISSMATVDPFPGLGAYGASKAALESLTRSIVTEGRADGIRAFSIAPGAVETAMLRGLFTREQLPADRTHAPVSVAEVAVACVLGRRDGEAGGVIVMPND